MKPVVVWKKSIYDNDFVCKCGAKLFHKEDFLLTDYVGYLDEDPNKLFCRHCMTPVAVIRLYNGTLPEGTIGGEWPEE